MKKSFIYLAFIACALLSNLSSCVEDSCVEEDNNFILGDWIVIVSDGDDKYITTFSFYEGGVLQMTENYFVDGESESYENIGNWELLEDDKIKFKLNIDGYLCFFEGIIYGNKMNVICLEMIGENPDENYIDKFTLTKK